jgi:hypothetical protein
MCPAMARTGTVAAQFAAAGITDLEQLEKLSLNPAWSMADLSPAPGHVREATLCCHAVTLSRCYVVTLLRCHVATRSRCYAVTVLRCHGDTLSRCSAVTVFRYHALSAHNHPICSETPLSLSLLMCPSHFAEARRGRLGSVEPSPPRLSLYRKFTKMSGS